MNRLQKKFKQDPNKNSKRSKPKNSEIEYIESENSDDRDFIVGDEDDLY